MRACLRTAGTSRDNRAVARPLAQVFIDDKRPYSTQSGHPADNLPDYAGASGRWRTVPVWLTCDKVKGGESRADRQSTSCDVGDPGDAPATRGALGLSTTSLDQDIRNLTGVGTWEWDLEKQSLVCSSEYHRIFEVDVKSPIAPSDMPRFRSLAANGVEAKVLREALRSGTPWKIVYPAVTARGRKIWIRSTGQAERVDGRTVRLFGLLQDVTDEQNAKAELERSRILLEEMSALCALRDRGMGVRSCDQPRYLVKGDAAHP